MRIVWLAALLTGCIVDPYAHFDPDALDGGSADQRNDQRFRDFALRDSAPYDATLRDRALLGGPDEPTLRPDRGPPIDAGEAPWSPGPTIEDDRLARARDVLCLDARDYAPPGTFNDDGWWFEWLVVQRPDGSTARPVERFFDNARPQDGGEGDDIGTPTVCLFLDLAGAWRLELRVTRFEPHATFELADLRITAAP